MTAREDQHWGRGDAPAERYINGRRVRAAGQVDEYGMYYIIPQSRGRWLLQALGWAVSIAMLYGVLYVVLIGGSAPQITINAQSTAADQSGGGMPPAGSPWPTMAPPSRGGVAPASEDTSSAAPTAEPTQVYAPPSVPTPTEGFWSAADLAAFTATTEAVYTPELMPTAPPAFVNATLEACADAALVAKSPALQLWCPPIIEREGD